MKTGEASSEKAQNTLVVKVSDNSQSQIYGKGPESCVYWGELANGADDLVSEYLFSKFEEICRTAKAPFEFFPKNWDRWVRACLQDYHEYFSRLFGISRYTLTTAEIITGHEICWTAPFWYSPTKPPAGMKL